MDSPGDNDALRFQFDMRAVLRRARTHLLLACAIAVLMLIAGWAGMPPPRSYAFLAGLYLAFAGIGASLGARLARRQQTPATLSIGGEGVRVPALWHWRGERRFALDAVRRVQRAVVAGEPSLFVGIAGQSAVVLPLHGFDSADEAQRFTDALVFRGRHPLQEGTGDLGPTRIALFVLALLVGLHLLREFAFGNDIGSLLLFGGLNRTLLLDGDWFRLLSYVLPQTDALALLLIGLALLRLLPALQRSLGSASMLLVLLVGTGTAGFGALPWIDGSVAVGAAAPVYALLGAVLWLRISQPARIAPTLWSVPVALWVAWLVLDLGWGLIGSPAAVQMRLLGLSGGCACAGLLELCERRARGALPWLGLVALACLAIAGTRLALEAMRTGGSTELALGLLQSDNATLGDANLGAWMLATSTAVDSSDLRQARSLFAERLRHTSAVNGEARDTLATLDYRLGAYADAVELEAQLQRETPNNVYATQLARFEHAAGAGARGGDVTIELRAGELCMQVVSAGVHDVDVLLLQSGRLLGLVQFASVQDRACSRLPDTLPAELQATAGRIAPSLRPGVLNVRFWSADADMLALP